MGNSQFIKYSKNDFFDGQTDRPTFALIEAPCCICTKQEMELLLSSSWHPPRPFCPVLLMRVGVHDLLAPSSSSSWMRLGDRNLLVLLTPSHPVLLHEAWFSRPTGPLLVFLAPSSMSLGALEETGGLPTPGPTLVLPLDKAGGY